jgi:hypothetical protein
MELYTFLMEFRGGTYISQVSSSTLVDAVKAWAYELSVDGIKHLGIKGKNEIIKNIDEIDLSPIDTVINVYCFCLRIKAGFIIVNVIKTSK